jgi:hypothetical protein
LFEEAKKWGLWRWLTEKRHVRQTADRAWQAFDEHEGKVKASWSELAQKAFREVEAQAAASADGRARRSYERAREDAKDIAPEIKAAVQRLRKADEECYKARMGAEAQFEEADRRLNTSMAREGAQIAIDAWLLREKYVRRMEALARRP